MKTTEYSLMYARERSYWWYVSKRLFIQTYLNFLPKNRSLKLLDAGCGTGANIQLLQQMGTVSAIDSSPVAIAFCKQRGFLFTKKTSLNSLPFQKNTFDVVTLLDVLYHQNIHNDVGTLKRLHQIIKPGGYLLLTDCAFPFLYGNHDINNQAKTRYTKPGLTQKLNLVGFTIVRSSYIFFFTFPFFAVYRLLTNHGLIKTSKSEYNISDSLNTFLILLERIESVALRYMNFPLGSSIIILAKKS